MHKESIVTMLVMGALLVLIVTHAGGFSTDVTSGGKFVDNTLGILSGMGRSAGVNYPMGTPPA